MRYLIISLITIQIMIGRQSQRNFIISLPSIEKYQSTRVSGVLNYTIPRVVHNTRENFASIMIDSSYNGYSYLSNVTNPIFWSEYDNESLITISYRMYDNDQSGYIGSWNALFESDTELSDIEGFNEGYTTDGFSGEPLTARYPSSIGYDGYISIFFGNGAQVDNNIPGFIYSTGTFMEGFDELSNLIYIGDCTTIGCVRSLLQVQYNPYPQKIFVSSQSGLSPFMFIGDPNVVPTPTSFHFHSASQLFYGYWLFDNNSTALENFGGNGYYSDFDSDATLGRPLFDINLQGIGYFVWSGYKANISSHTLHYIMTEDYGENWDQDQIYSITDEVLSNIFTEAGLLGSTALDQQGNEVILDEAFIGYNYEIISNETSGLQIIATVIPKSSTSDSLYFSQPGAGYYHIYNNNPTNSEGWNATLIRDMSNSFKAKMHQFIPTWQYLFADASISNTGRIYVSTSVPMNVDEASSSYSDTDIFISYSDDNGLTWTDLGNITNTPSGYDEDQNYISQFELHPHLSPTTDANGMYITFQIPAMPHPPSDVNWDSETYETVKNYIYFGILNSPGDGNTKIIINEIMQNPSAVSDNDGEWFEIYNNSNEQVDIANWVIKDQGDNLITIDPECCNTILPPYSFYVLGSNLDFESNGGVIIDYGYDRNNFSLSNSEDEIIIIDNAGFLKDVVEYDNTFPDPNGKSMELLFYDYDNSLGASWVESENQLSSGDYGTPGEENSVIAPLISISYDSMNDEDLYVHVAGWSDSNGDCIVSGSFDGHVVTECDTAFFNVRVENIGSGNLVLENYHLNNGLNTLEYIDRWKLDTEFPIIIPPGDFFLLEVYFIPWRELNDFSPWFGKVSNILSIEHNAEPFISNVEMSSTVYIHGKAYGFEIGNTFLAEWENYYSQPILAIESEIWENIRLVSYGTEEIEIDDIFIESDYFSVIASDGSLNIGESIPITINFDQESNYDDLDTIKIESNAEIFYPVLISQDNNAPEQGLIIKRRAVDLDVDEQSFLKPSSFAVYQNYPNPFNPVTKLRYDLPQDSHVKVTVYDMLGNVINNLVNANQSSGYKSIQWDATNNQGQQVSAGVYLYSIEAGDFRQTKKMILLK